MWGTAGREREYYKLVNLPIPKDLVVEAGAFVTLPDKRIAIGTRRGDIYLLSGVDEEKPNPKYELFASGLDEIFGLAYKDDAFYVSQSCEMTRVTDRNTDGKADLFEVISDAWGYANYHEYAFGSRHDKQGNIWVVLCLTGSGGASSDFRGWCVRVTPDGKMLPTTSGIRSPGGIGQNHLGDMFYCDNQGLWNGSSSLKHLSIYHR